MPLQKIIRSRIKRRTRIVALLNAAFAVLRQRNFASCIIWAHAGNNARFFYETMGGRLVAERTARMMGDAVPETAFGWKTLALAERSHAK